jgi:hypothetical protein
MNNTDTDFGTVSYNACDVYKYLKKYYNIDFDRSHRFTTQGIYNIVESGISKKPFSEFLIDFLKRTGRFDFDPGDNDNSYKAYIAYCSGEFAKSGIIKSQSIFEKLKPLTNEILRKQLKNWFTGIVPSRESIFLLAFALKMNCTELDDFLTKGICDKGVNYKNPAETAAYSCLMNGQSYGDALRILENAKGKTADIRSEQSYIYTINYKTIFDKISDEEKLTDYIARLISEQNDPQTSLCIKDCYEDLIGKVSRNAVMDKKIAMYDRSASGLSGSKDIRFGTIERYLYYYTPMKSENGRIFADSYALYSNGNISGKQNNRLKSQKWFFSTILRRSDLKKMLDGTKKISRDTIITLAFFVTCEDNPEYSEYEYISEINDCLSFCRYEQINFSYPYDMFIFMCLQTDDPLISFRKIWKMSWVK